MTIQATLGGERLMADRGPIGWSITSGTTAHQRTFDMEASAADRLFKRSITGETMTLLIEPDDREALEVQKLRVLSTGPTEVDGILNVLVADRRWSWNRNFISRTYNLRRRNGERRILEENGVPLPRAITPITDDVGYAPFSLEPRDRPTKAWTASEIIRDIIRELAPGQFVIPVRDFKRVIDVESFTIHDPGDRAMAKALSLLPGIDIYVDTGAIA